MHACLRRSDQFFCQDRIDESGKCRRKGTTFSDGHVHSETLAVDTLVDEFLVSLGGKIVGDERWVVGGGV
jgi:hypothetical protein